MTDTRPGTLIGIDLTVPDAVAVRDFYAAVFGWETQGVDMGGYEDYQMVAPGSDQPAAGICHARGENADQPPVWMAYLAVPDLEAAIATVRANGGETVSPIRGDAGSWRFCVIRDPAGAMISLMQTAG